MRSHAVVLAVAVVVCCGLGLRLLQAEGFDRGTAWRALLWLTLAAFIGGHLHYLLLNWPSALSNPWRTLKPWVGLRAPGAILALAVVAPVFAYRHGVSAGALADAFAPLAGIGIAIGRFACFLNGCCHGTPCDAWWCVKFVATAGPVHPLQLYFALAALGIFGVAVWLRRHRRYPGQVALVCLLLFSGSALGLEFLRADSPARVYWGPLPHLAWSAMALTLASATWLAVAGRRGSTGASLGRDREISDRH
jgi:phosphatidylglycerol:prolipoprotein diacylglycerol transferase